MPRQTSFVFNGFRGMDSSSGIESLGPSAGSPDRYPLLMIENGRITRDGGVYIRHGTETVADLGTSARVDNVYGFEKDDWAVFFAKSSTGIYQSTDPDSGVFYSIGVTRTASETDFFFGKRKDVFAINKTDGQLRIAISIIDSINVAGGTVNLRAGDGLDVTATGTIYIRGIAVTYTGVSTDQLTGCTGLTAAMVAGDIVTQTTALPNNPKGTCMGELEDSALAAGVSEDASALYWSEASSVAEPELFYDFPTEYVTPLPRDITAIQSGNRATMIGMKKGIRYSPGFEITIGDPQIVSLSSTHSVPNPYCIAQTDEDFVILTGEGRILPAGQTDAGFAIVEDVRNPRNDMDYPVQGFLRKNIDLADGSENFVAYNPASREIVSSVKVTQGFNKDVILQRDIGAWSIDIGKTVACRTVFKGKTYGGDARNGKIYRDDSGVLDGDSPINFRMITGLMSLDEKRIQFDALGLTIGGLLSATGEFTLRVYGDGTKVFESDITADELVEKGLMFLTTGVGIGSGDVGSEQIGSGGNAIEGFAFTYPLELLLECHTLQVEIETQIEGVGIEIREMKIDIETEAEMQFNTF